MARLGEGVDDHESGEGALVDDAEKEHRLPPRDRRLALADGDEGGTDEHGHDDHLVGDGNACERGAEK